MRGARAGQTKDASPQAGLIAVMNVSRVHCGMAF